jgi:hypothetical protein
MQKINFKGSNEKIAAKTLVHDRTVAKMTL